MKIDKINCINKFNTQTYNKTLKQENIKTPYSDYKVGYYMPIFCGNIPLAKLYEEYNWYINCDRVPAVNSFLKINGSKEVMTKFLEEILKTKDRGYEFVESIVSQPRNISELKSKIAEKILPNSDLLQIYSPTSLYNQAYTNFLKTKYDNARSMYELLKIRPDWSGIALIEKYKRLHGNEDLTIGCVPKQITTDHLYRIIEYLKDKMEVGYKPYKEIESIVIDNRTYEFKYFTEGKSSKNVFGLFIPALGKKYVIKMDNPEARSLEAPFALGTLAKIDGYLTSNSSRNSAPLCYYDHKNNFSVYKYIEHAAVSENTNNLNVIRQKLPDFNALGLHYNDTVGFKNFFCLNERSLDTHYRMFDYDRAINNNEWISVDNDHVTYSSQLQPMLNWYNSSLPNGMGMFN